MISMIEVIGMTTIYTFLWIWLRTGLDLVFKENYIEGTESLGGLEMFDIWIRGSEKLPNWLTWCDYCYSTWLGVALVWMLKYDAHIYLVPLMSAACINLILKRR